MVRVRLLVRACPFRQPSPQQRTDTDTRSIALFNSPSPSLSHSNETADAYPDAARTLCRRPLPPLDVQLEAAVAIVKRAYNVSDARVR